MHARAMLVSLRVSSWAATKDDKAIAQHVAATHNASGDAGKYTKNLLPGSEFEVPAAAKSSKARASAAVATVNKANSHKALIQHIAAVRVKYYAMTLPWSDDGWRLLPIKNYQSFAAFVRESQHTFDTLLAEFERDYPALRELARKLLNGMFREDDYPTVIAAKFKFGCEYSPVPSGTDFRVTLADAEIAAIAKSTEERVAQGFRDAQADAVKRLYETLARIRETLATGNPNRKDGMKTFKDTLIGNARKVCDALKTLNLTDDPELEKYRREAELLAVSEPETLREVPAVRAETAARAQSILDAMTATYGKGMFSK
jgi:hypothetical protein